MTETELEKFLFKLSGVSRFDLPNLSLSRYLIHDIPFAVLIRAETGESFLNIKLSCGKAREAKARYQHIVRDSEVYDPSSWIAVRLNVAPALDSAVYEWLRYAYARLLNELSALSRVIYLEERPIKYDVNYKRLLELFSIKPAIDYGSTITFPEWE